MDHRPLQWEFLLKNAEEMLKLIFFWKNNQCYPLKGGLISKGKRSTVVQPLFFRGHVCFRSKLSEIRWISKASRIGIANIGEIHVLCVCPCSKGVTGNLTFLESGRSKTCTFLESMIVYIYRPSLLVWRFKIYFTLLDFWHVDVKTCWAKERERERESLRKGGVPESRR